MAGIMAGVTCILIVGGYYEYNYWGLRESFIRSQYGHIQITLKGYKAQKIEEPFRYLIPSSEKLVTLLEQLEEVEVVVPYLTFFGILETPTGNSELVMVRGVKPEAERQLTTFFTRKLGKDLTDQDRGMAELGFELARKTGLEIGSEFWLTTITADGTQNAIPLTVKGIIGSYSADFDARILRLPLGTAQLLTGARGIQELVVLLRSTEKTVEMRQKIQQLLQQEGWDLEVSTWQEQTGYYSQVVQFYGGYFRLIFVIVVVVAFSTTLNTMIMGLFERMGEIGTLRSFGANRWFLLRLFLAEGLMFGLGGTVAGFLLSLGITVGIHLAGGIPMAPPPGLTTRVSVYILFTPFTVGIATLTGLAVPLLATLFPACRILRADIIDQIRSGEK